jgi:steroid 5-alpha reductase family enzyme
MLSSLVLWQQEELVLDVVSLGGLYVFTLGLLTETVADLQKYRFNNQPKNKGKWIDSGLWKYSRHPNYLGEIVVWVGVWLFVLPYLEGVNMYVVAISPLYIAGLLIFGSGIPILEKSADKRWGKDKKYQEYKKKTPVLVPFVK